MKLNNSEGWMWDRVGAWLSKVFHSFTGWENTLVVLYHDMDHWSIFVVELTRMYYLDPIPRHHRGRYVQHFVFRIHLGWALARRIVVGSDPWHSLLKQQPFAVLHSTQKESWECGFAACMMFLQFMLERDSRLETDVNVIFHK